MNPYAPPTAEVADVHAAVLRVKYKNRFTDIVLFNAVHQLLSPVVQVLYVGLALFVFMLAPKDFDASVAMVIALFAYITMWIFQILFNVIYLYSRNNRTILTEHILEIQDEALLEQTHFNKSYFYWHGIIRAVSRPGFIAIYTTPFVAHIIPNRAFSSRGERAGFLSTVQEKIRAAREL
jgi:ribose/xylose/arabinose/galactoside ABC-type transport system permease subunit